MPLGRANDRGDCHSRQGKLAVSDQIQPLLLQSGAARALLWCLALSVRQSCDCAKGLDLLDCLDRSLEGFRFPAAANEFNMSEADQFDLLQMARVLRQMWDEVDHETEGDSL